MEYVEIVRELGFPIFIALWLLLRVDGILVRIANSMTDLANNHKDIHEKLEDLRYHVCDKEERI